MKKEKSTLYELQRIARRAKQRVGNDESLDSSLVLIREELLKEGYDYDIFDIMSGLEESYSVFYAEYGF